MKKKQNIKVYESIDSRFILEDLYSKLAQFNMGKEEDIIQAIAFAKTQHVICEEVNDI